MRERCRASAPTRRGATSRRGEASRSRIASAAARTATTSRRPHASVSANDGHIADGRRPGARTSSHRGALPPPTSRAWRPRSRGHADRRLRTSRVDERACESRLALTPSRCANCSAIQLDDLLAATSWTEHLTRLRAGLRQSGVLAELLGDEGEDGRWRRGGGVGGECLHVGGLPTARLRRRSRGARPEEAEARCWRRRRRAGLASPSVETGSTARRRRCAQAAERACRSSAGQSRSAGRPASRSSATEPSLLSAPIRAQIARAVGLDHHAAVQSVRASGGPGSRSRASGSTGAGWP